MSYAIKSHKLIVDGATVPYRATPNRGGTLVPEGIIVHDTAGDVDGAGSVGWLCDKRAKASAHVVVHRDGRITQLAPFNVVTWHAGASSWRGRSACNGFTVGIEFANPGKLTRTGLSTYRNGDGYALTLEAGMIVDEYSSEVHGRGLWLQYSDAQIAAGSALCLALKAAYPTIGFIATHWQVSPGRKVDTGPQFPLEELRDRVLFDGSGEEEVAVDGCDATATTGVNQRRWPSLADNIIQTLPKGARARVVRSGVYTNGGDTARWFLVAAGGNEGWVHGAYLDLD